MLETSARRQLALLLSCAAAAVIVLLPFHALFTTWLGSNFGYIDSWRIWKEIIIFGMFIPTFMLALTNKQYKEWLKNDILPKLIVLYLILTLARGVISIVSGDVNRDALIYGLFSNLRYLGFFAITLALTLETKLLSTKWWKILFLPATVVVSFGILQLFLPHDFLRHFGYGADTIPAFQTVDQKIDYQRIQSTLRGANPLGAYLLFVIVALMGSKLKPRAIKYSVLTLAAVALWFTYSRSAWLGLLASLGVYLAITKKQFVKQNSKLLIASSVLLLAIGLIGFSTVNENDSFENIVFHTNEQSGSSESSNASRLRAIKDGAKDILHEPFGRGPGTAGPASTRNNHTARISENYYIQIGQEVGWLGLGLLIAISGLLLKRLYGLRSDNRAPVLFAAFVGLIFVNLISHAWADDTLGLLFFGLAGVVLGDGILNKKRK